MHLTSAKSLIKRRGSSSLVEWLLIAVHAVLYLAVVFWVLSPSRALAFIAIQQGLFGLYLRVSFAPNHKGMPTLTYDSKMSFLDRQVLTSRNVSGGRPITFLLGGLNYQIEHHLFPTMPRRNLSRAQPIVRAFCREVGLEYRQDSIAASYQGAFRSLRKSAAPTRPSDEVNLALAALWQKTP